MYHDCIFQNSSSPSCPEAAMEGCIAFDPENQVIFMYISNSWIQARVRLHGQLWRGYV